MPIYEFYCEPCNIIFNFFSSRINTTKIPSCPKCDRDLKRQMSTFSTIGRAKEENDELPPGFDKSRMERALGELMGEAENINEDDPRQMAQFMRKFTEKSGLDLGDSMQEAISRLEAGEDPEKIEAEMGDIFEGEDPLAMMKKKGGRGVRSSRPLRDETLYDL
jgi:putative FmdB family regulatory protein